MSKSLGHKEVRQYALVGAQVRLDSLRVEIASLIGAFPELRRKLGAGLQVKSTKKPAKKASKRGHRRPMDAAERQEVSERMKRYWAGKRREREEQAARPKRGASTRARRSGAKTSAPARVANAATVN